MARIQSASESEVRFAEAPFQKAIFLPGCNGWTLESFFLFTCADGPTEPVLGGSVIETPRVLAPLPLVPVVLAGEEALGRLLRLSTYRTVSYEVFIHTSSQ